MKVCLRSNLLFVVCTGCYSFIAITISITSEILQIQAVRTSLSFQPSVIGDTRRETQIIKAYANHTMLTTTPRKVHLVVSKISTHLCRSRPKLICFDYIRKGQHSSFQNDQIFRTSLPGMTSSPPHTIHSNGRPTLFPVWGFIMQMMIFLSFLRRRKTAPSD